MRRDLSNYVAFRQLLSPANYGSATKLASDNDTNPIIDGYAAALFIFSHTNSSDKSWQANVQWASSGNASDAAEISTSTDAFYLMDTDQSTGLYLISLDFKENAMETGVLAVEATFNDSDIHAAVGVALYGGTNTSSNIGQTNTVVVT